MKTHESPVQTLLRPGQMDPNLTAHLIMDHEVVWLDISVANVLASDFSPHRSTRREPTTRRHRIVEPLRDGHDPRATFQRCQVLLGSNARPKWLTRSGTWRTAKQLQPTRSIPISVGLMNYQAKKQGIINEPYNTNSWHYLKTYVFGVNVCIL